MYHYWTIKDTRTFLKSTVMVRGPHVDL